MQNLDFKREYEKHLTYERMASPVTIKSHLYYLEKFLQFSSKSPVETQEKDIQDFVMSLKAKSLSNGTVSNFITALRIFYNWLAYKNKNSHLTEISYFLNKMVRIKTNSSIPKVPTLLEAERLMTTLCAYKQACSFNKNLPEYGRVLRDCALISMLRWASPRSREIRQIIVDDLNLEENTVLIQHGKGGKQRVSLLNSATRDFLREYISYFNLHTTDKLFSISQGHTLNGIIRFWARKAGINPQIHAHSFRHLHVTEARDKGVPDHHIKDQVGNYSCLDTYTHLSLKSRREKYEVCGIG